MSSPTVICVLGMSRTGTSLTTRILALAGVYLGPGEELLNGDLRQLAGEGEAVLERARDTNPEGFWEHYRLMRLNERILRKLGGNWRQPPPLRSGWEESADLDPEREEALALIDECFSGHGLWGWKDPRNCLTLPFWQRLLPCMRYVICLRNPIDVAASLQRRDGMPFEQAIALWHDYLSRALAHTAGAPRLLVRYESHFEDPQGTATRLAAFAGCPAAFDGAATRSRLAAAVDERLWRNRTAAEEVLADPRVPARVAELYLHSERLDGSEPVRS